MLLRKQTDFKQTFQVTLDFRPRHPGYEAGIVVWYSMYSYASIGLAMICNEAEEMTKAVVTKLPASNIGAMNVSQ
jgi:Beta xylosidase C-terminal Concanavalin A-like domain